jgi:glutathione peroxidase
MKNIFFVIIIGGFMMLNAQIIYDFTVQDSIGTEISLNEFRGKVILLVNVASKCGFTKQYEGLQRIFEKYHEQGFIILGFPANNFMNQEPGNNEEIRAFCRLNYGVTFPIFSKISVKGKEIHPLYDFLISKKTNPRFAGRITWNFNKFLIDREGKIVARFDSRTVPESEQILQALEAELSK